ncbi:MAG: hypothetical protein NUV51_03935 [Sulfuricaulis sp.]|nr:hypothetical protein [Sulfuricaulis sp.]
MAFNGSGSWTLPAGQPVVTGTTISSTVHNDFADDIQTSFETTYCRDGQATPTANLPFGGFRLTNVGNATALTDAARCSQVQNGSYNALSSVAGTNTITAATVPAITAYTEGQKFSFLVAGTNTGQPTLNISSVGAAPIFWQGSTATSSALVSGRPIEVMYVSTSSATGFHLMAQSGFSPAPMGPLHVSSLTVDLTSTLTGAVYIGDTANGDLTLGLTINQGAADNQIIAFKSSDVAHGITSSFETDTFGAGYKIAISGGLRWVGASVGATQAIRLDGYSDTDDTDKTTGGRAYVYVIAAKKTGTTIGAVGADANLFGISDNGTTRFLFDAEGSAHADVAWTTFDKFDDVALLNGLDLEMQRRAGKPIQAAFGEWVRESRDILQREGIFNFYDDGPRAMMNMTRMHMLEVGAIRQLHRDFGVVKAGYEARLKALEERQ